MSRISNPGHSTTFNNLKKGKFDIYGVNKLIRSNPYLGIVDIDASKSLILKKILDLSSIKDSTVKILMRLLKEGKIAIGSYHDEGSANSNPKNDNQSAVRILLHDAISILEEGLSILTGLITFKPKYEELKVLLDLKEYSEIEEDFQEFHKRKADNKKRMDNISSQITQSSILEDCTANEHLMNEYKKRRANIPPGDSEQQEDLIEEFKNKKAELQKAQLEEKQKVNEYKLKIQQIEDEQQLKYESKESLLKYSFEEFLGIIKYFILSPVEKKYIENIENELKRSEVLDSKIKDLNKNIKLENNKKKKEVQTTKPEKDNPEKLLREIVMHENKLEKAHQKLNTTISQNTQLREKIDVLRKEKNVIEEIYTKLKQELHKKRKQIEETITNAGRAYINRNNAEKKLEMLQERAEDHKKNFEIECEKLNESIDKEKKFKKFLKQKQKEEDELKKKREELLQNSKIIKEKKKNNEDIMKEYKQSSEKEQQIKQAFDKISKETGIKDCKELLEAFKELHLKNVKMNSYVKDLTVKLEDIEDEIAKTKDQISEYNTNGATKDIKKHEIKVKLSEQIVQEEKKKQILKVQYEKSLESMNTIKDYLTKLLETIGIDQDKVNTLKQSAVTEENLMKYFGILEQKGIEIVSQYAKLIAEQIKHDKGDQHDAEQQITNLVNIIQYENANILHQFLKEQPPKEDITNIYHFDFSQNSANVDQKDTKEMQNWVKKREEILFKAALNEIHSKKLFNL